MRYTKSMRWFEHEAARARVKPDEYVPIPSSIDGVTSAWMTQCLTVRFPGTVIAEANVKNLAQNRIQQHFARDRLVQ